jgi:hypothetical protein
LRRIERLTVRSQAQAVHPDGDACGEDRTSEHGGEGAFGKAQTPGRLDSLPVPENERNPSQYFALRHGRIGRWHRIPAHQNFTILRLALGHDAPGYDAVSKKAPVAAEQNDVSCENGIARYALNHKRIAGPDGGQHAPSCNSQTQTAGGAQYFSGQLTSESMSISQGLIRKLHDTFELLAHDREVFPTFPHERAVVTNTFS